MKNEVSHDQAKHPLYFQGLKKRTEMFKISCMNIKLDLSS